MSPRPARCRSRRSWSRHSRPRCMRGQHGWLRRGPAADGCVWPWGTSRARRRRLTSRSSRSTTLGAWTGGWIVRRRAEQLVAAQAAGPELARQAVALRANALARELHDVVAHSVTIISLQAGAAEAVLDGDPGQARVHLEAVRKTAPRRWSSCVAWSVYCARRAGLRATGGLGRLDELIDEMRTAGLTIELCEEGTRPALPPGVDLSAFRIVQESLTNVRRHAGAVPTRVRLRYCGDALELEVVNSRGSGKGALGAGTGQWADRHARTSAPVRRDARRLRGS